MLKQELIEKNPVRALEPETGVNTIPHRMGLIVGRKGSGKTALLVQVALDGLLRGNHVVHVSIGQGLDKAKAWYEDLFQELSSRYRLEDVGAIHDEIARRRMIMTFQTTSFSVPKLEERLTDLIHQNVFHPQGIVVDGYDFEKATRPQVEELLAFTKKHRIHTWLTATRTADSTRKSALGVPAPCDAFEDLFDTILLIGPDDQGHTLRALKYDVPGASRPRDLVLDPRTLLARMPA
jgi:hypothetical protein